MRQMMLPVPRCGVRLTSVGADLRADRKKRITLRRGDALWQSTFLRRQRQGKVLPNLRAVGDAGPYKVSEKKTPRGGVFSKRSPRRKELKAQSAIATRNDYAAGQVSKKKKRYCVPTQYLFFCSPGGAFVLIEPPLCKGRWHFCRKWRWGCAPAVAGAYNTQRTRKQKPNKVAVTYSASFLR